MAMVMPAIGDVAVMRMPVGGYGACQVVGIDRGEVAVCALAWESAEPPELRELAEAPPLTLDHHAHQGEIARIRVVAEEPPPPGWRWLGRLPVPATMPAGGNPSSGWSWVPLQIAAQRRWDRQLPAEARRAYRAAATRGLIEVDLGAGPVTLGAAIGRLELAGAGPVPWSALDQLGRCTSLTWAGPDRGLVAALAAHPIVDNLTWAAAPARLDLRGTGLTSLALGGTVDLLQLPDGLTSLHLMDGARVEAVSAAGDGEWLTLATSGAHVPAGLDGLRDLRVVGAGTISAAPLSALRRLESLWLTWRDAPGDLDDAAALRELPRLAHLRLTNAYGIDAGTLPELPALTALTIHGLRRTAATAIKARYRRAGIHLSITGARDDRRVDQAK